MCSQQVASECMKSIAHFSENTTTILEEKVACQGLVITSLITDF